MKKITHTLITMTLLFLGMSYSFAQQPEILSDIDSRPRPSDPRALTVIDGKIYFASTIYNRGFQLSVYNGNSTENILFREGDPGSSFYPNEFVSIGTDIFFPSRTDEYGREIYKYDGSEVTVVDINPGSSDSSPSNLIVFNSKLYFNATDGVNGFELWEYDGTNIAMVEDIQPGAGTSNPNNFIVYNNELLFVANDGTNGYELWHFDGTSVTMVEDINPGVGHSNPDHYAIYNDKLYFAASNVAWVYDGNTLESLASVTGQTVGTDPRYFTIYDGDLYFNSLLAASGAELWKYDGTDVGMVANINAGSASSFPRFLTVGAGNLFFDAETANGRELWKFDGVTATEYDLNSGAPHSYPSNFTAVGDKIYFRATTVNDGQELWMHDGTSATLIDINGGSLNSTPNYLVEYDNALFFSANNGEGVFLYTHDGTDLTKILTNTNTQGSVAQFPTVFNNKLYFAADDYESGMELYDYDGSTINMTDILVGDESSYPSNFFVDGDKLYFSASNETSGVEMFILEGTNLTLVDINSVTNDSYPQQFTAFNGAIYFRATDGTNGIELWKYDGISASMVHDINPGGDSYPSDLIVINSKLYFSANDGTNGYELWQYDGTTATMVQDFNVGDSYPQDLYAFNSELYFRVTTSTYGDDLWKYDGTTATPIDINPDAGSSYARELIEYDGNLYFIADDGTNGTELWKYDGTTATLIDINDSGSSNPYAKTVHNGLLYFNAYDVTYGSELRSYDGTNLNLVIDYSDNEDTYVEYMMSYGSMLYLNYYDYDDATYKLYSYNGTDLTFLKQMALQSSNDYGAAVEYGNYMYFPADSEEYGDVEMWRIRKTSEETDILTFTLAEQVSAATIDAVNHTVVIEAVFGTDLSSLSPSITVSDYATINPLSGATIDFSSPVVFTVTSEFGNTQDWTISVSAETNDAPTNLSLSANTIDELNEVDAIIGSFTTTDPNTSDLHTYSLVAGSGDTDNASFSISGSNLLATEVFDFETKSSYSIRVQTFDGRGGTFEKQLTISINNISGITQVISITTIADMLNTDIPFDVDASVDSGLELTYAVSGPATISGTTITLDGGTGTVTVTVSQAGNDDYAAAEEQVSFEITEGRASQTITFATIDNQFFEMGSLTLSATASSALEVSYELVSGPASVSGNVVSFTGLGTVTISASQAGNDSFLAATSVEQSFEIITVTGVDHDLARLIIYPNPTQDQLTVQTSQKEVSINLYNANGKQIQAIKPNEVNSIAHLDRGIYFLSVTNAQGTITHKIIKN